MMTDNHTEPGQKKATAETRPESGTKPMTLGQRLVSNGFITEAQSDLAAAWQKQHGGLFGKALIDLGFLTTEQFEEILRSSETSKSGERLLSSGLVTRDQLMRALSYQAEFGGRIGSAIVALGYASKEQIDSFFQTDNQKKTIRLGDRLVNDKLITQAQLDAALLFQKNSGGRLGEVLLALGYIQPEDLYRALATQFNIGRTGTHLDFKDSRKIPYRVALKYNAIIAGKNSISYILAVRDLLDKNQVADIESYLDKPVEQVLATMAEIEQFWETVYQFEQSADSVYGLFDDQPQNSAIVTITRMQAISILAVLAFTVICIVVDYSTTLLVLNVIFQLIYAFFTVLKIVILVRGHSRKDMLKYTPEQINAIDERDLPVFTLLIPAYKEASIARHLVDRMNRIDYPAHKLDIRILLEEDDKETLEAFQAIEDLPPQYTLLVVPATEPHTKPKACNYGLIRARGDYVVIYDAEDMPESDQLKKVYLAFQELPDSYVCVQSKLNYFNSSQNILTKWFTHEYSTWFDVLLIGVMSFDSPLPLGGTSNHFKASFLKEVGAWDPFNVTEDADLGIRLYKHRYHTAVLDSVTWEEANSKVGNWIRQRSRWLKGYMQTWLVHMRNPVKLFRDLGAKGFVGYHAMLLGTPVIPLLNPFFWIMMVLWFVFRPDFIQQMFPGALYYIALFQFIIGNFFFTYSNLLGCYSVIRDSECRGAMNILYSVVLPGMLAPAYWVLMSVAAYKAAVQLIKNPFYWEKTDHGLTSQIEKESVAVE